MKRPGVPIVPDNLWLGDYADVLRWHNGIEGFVSPMQYLMLWSVEEIPSLNAGYRVGDYAPDIVLVGSDGGGTAYGRDKSTGMYGSVPFIGMSRASFKEMGGTFEEFLSNLAAN